MITGILKWSGHAAQLLGRLLSASAGRSALGTQRTRGRERRAAKEGMSQTLGSVQGAGEESQVLSSNRKTTGKCNRLCGCGTREVPAWRAGHGATEDSCLRPCIAARLLKPHVLLN